MFTVKIHEAAKRAGVVIEFVKSEIDAVEKARSTPSLLIIDLNCNSVDSLHLITALKSDPDTKSVPLLGYVSHAQGDLKVAAQEAGCDQVLARSAFSANLQNLLRR